MNTEEDIQHNRLIYLEDSVAIHWVYNAETLEELINTIHHMHNTTTLNEKLFAGELCTAFIWYVNKNGVHHYTTNSLLYLGTLREKYVKMYEEFIVQLHLYARQCKF